ncbi:MAG: AzlD domain-containing protein [Desulfobacter sp.]|nr:AzlD domain-containing protein [Desulfobacter sp.]WDP87587.1 MAG: AzlD domain-containing protein [Desulfobacter sp.]
MDNFSSGSLIPLILGMALVTYGPRLVPFLFFSRIKIPLAVDGFLKSIPVAAIGALIVPGVLTATPDLPQAALWGMGFTLVYGVFRGGIIIPVLGSVGMTYLVLTFF